MLLMQIRQSKEQFNNEVMAMKTRKAMLLQELEDIQLQLIDIQYRLDASKRKPVPTIPIIYPEERHQDPFHVSILAIFPLLNFLSLMLKSQIRLYFI